MRAKIFEYNPNTGVIRWRYEDESHDDFGWPNYGRILKKKKKKKKSCCEKFKKKGKNCCKSCPLNWA